MIDQRTRAAILRLHESGHGSRQIAKSLRIARGTVRAVLEKKTEEVPAILRHEKASPYHNDIVELYADCKGNIVRVHEELLSRMHEKDSALELSYQALTAYCRKHGVGHESPKPAGRYEFAPGQEMQHDTSPHRPHVGGKEQLAQTASLVFAFSRMTFFQIYPRFTRFECKVFLTDALRYFDGVCATCMVDNTHVIILHGTGARMTPVPEMDAFAERLGFTFRAHEVGDANRSARVEGPFQHIEHNFLAGRKFKDWNDLNHQAIEWCDTLNGKFSRQLRASRRELFQTERAHLRRLPIWLPDVYALHHRIVDLEGYVHIRGAHYSVPYTLIGRQLEVRETKDEVLIFDGPRQVALHSRLIEPGRRSTKLEHRPPRGERLREAPTREERDILEQAPELERFVGELKKRSPGRAIQPLRHLRQMIREYPREELLAAIDEAGQYGLYDLERVERMALRKIDRVFFPNLIANLNFDQRRTNDEDDHE